MAPEAESSDGGPPRLRDIALGAVAGTCLRANEARSAPEEQILQRIFQLVSGGGRTLAQNLDEVLAAPAEEDAELVRLGRKLMLAPSELLVVALAAAVEQDPIAGRVLAHVQAPVGGSRPTLGLICHAFDAAFESGGSTLPRLLSGPAVEAGLLTILADTAPLPERPVMVPTTLCLALLGCDGRWAGATIETEAASRVPLPNSVIAEVQRHATALEGQPNRSLVLRTGSPAEGRAVAAAIAHGLGCRPLFIETEQLAGLGPWLLLRRLLPVFCFELGPGERRTLPAVTGYAGPLLAVCGPDGAVENARGPAASWTLPMPPETERRALWTAALDQPELAEQLARDYRHGAGRIAHLGRLAQHEAAIAGRREVRRDDIVAAAWTGEGSGLDALAEPLRARVPDDALVMPKALQEDLQALILRCRLRDNLARGLGASATTRYRPGVRALFTGPSGTGKTLAAGWIATRLGLPLYRVDLASVTSKYIGETEKHLSQLLARAEQAEVILLFDEADSLFGKRTDIADANDRFANAQTNYLLQRIENFDGIVLLTSNSQARFDTAFARRLDFVIDFPAPGPEERRALWRSHLGDNCALAAPHLNQIAALIDVSGGNIRNAVFAAAVRAAHEGRAIEYPDVLAGVESELRKLGRQMAAGLQPNR